MKTISKLNLYSREVKMSNKGLVNSGVNVLTLIKNNQFYAMTAAWAMMAGYEEVLILLGSQSDTGRTLEKGDVVGLSALSTGNVKEAFFFGDKHSQTYDKNKVDYLEDYEGVKVVKSARVQIKAEVIDVMHLKYAQEDNLVYLKVLKVKENSGDFLDYASLVE